MRQIGRKGKLVLKDGSVYRGTLYGKRNAVGEVVFTTGMSGYQETLTDPSFCDQIVVMTYPLVGNYGINKDFNQGRRCFFQGYVISELCDHPSNWKNEKSLEDFLALPEVHDQVAKVTTPEIYTMGEGKYHVAVMDYGIKQNILNYLASFGCRLTVFPAFTSAQEVFASQPDGIFLSNGPGDPKDLTSVIEEVKKFIGKRPIFGICLGHQLMALANGADTYKMKFGHRGINHPVKDLLEHKVMITSQNHGYAVDEKSLEGKNIEITNISLNDHTIEGVRYLDHPTFTVQYHPEASPGPGGHE